MLLSLFQSLSSVLIFFVVEGVTKTMVVLIISDPSVKLIIVNIGEGALCRSLDSGGVRLFLGEGMRGHGETCSCYMVVLVGVSAFWTDVAKSLLNDRCRNRNWRWSGRVRFIGQRVYAKSMIVKVVFLRVFQGRVVKGLITELMGLKECNRNFDVVRSSSSVTRCLSTPGEENFVGKEQWLFRCLHMYFSVTIIAVIVSIETLLVNHMMGRGVTCSLPWVLASMFSLLLLTSITGVSPWVMNFILSELRWAYKVAEQVRIHFGLDCMIGIWKKLHMQECIARCAVLRGRIRCRSTSMLTDNLMDTLIVGFIELTHPEFFHPIATMPSHTILQCSDEDAL